MSVWYFGELVLYKIEGIVGWIIKSQANSRLLLRIHEDFEWIFNNKNKPYSSWWVWMIPLRIFEDTYSLWNLCLQQTRFWPWFFKKSNRIPLLHQRLILLHYRVNRIPYHELHDDKQTIKGNKLICRHCGKIGHIIDNAIVSMDFHQGIRQINSNAALTSLYRMFFLMSTSLWDRINQRKVVIPLRYHLPRSNAKNYLCFWSLGLRMTMSVDKSGQ